MGATIPTEADLNGTGLTTLQYRNNLADFLEVVTRMIGAVAAETVAISAGVLTPTAGSVLVGNEGATSLDLLDTMDPAGYAAGAVVHLSSSNTGDVTTINHSAAVNGFSLAEGAASTFDLTAGSSIVVRWDATAQSWVEVERHYGNDLVAFRSFLGLGSAALLNDGQVNADTLDGIDSSGFIQTGDPLGDADSVDGLHASDFVQLAETALQVLAGNLQVNSGSIISNVSVGTEARYQIDIGGTMRGLVLFHADDPGPSSYLTFRLFDTDGLTLLGEIRMQADGEPQYTNATETRTFQFVEDLPPNPMGGVIRTGVESSTLDTAGDAYDEINLDRHSFFPHVVAEDNMSGDVQTQSGRQFTLAPEYTNSGTDADRNNPILVIRATHRQSAGSESNNATNSNWEAKWHYLDSD